MRGRVDGCNIKHTSLENKSIVVCCCCCFLIKNMLKRVKLRLLHDSSCPSFFSVSSASSILRVLECTLRAERSKPILLNSTNPEPNLNQARVKPSMVAVIYKEAGKKECGGGLASGAMYSWQHSPLLQQHRNTSDCSPCLHRCWGAV